MNRKRVAVSELMGTLIMVTVTLIAGAAAFGWVNGQASTSESAYGQNAAAGVNYLQEHFAPITSTYTAAGGGGCGSTCTVANYWIFNNGRLAFTLATLQIQSAAGASSSLSITYTSSSYTASACTPSTGPPGSGFTVITGTSPIPIGTITQYQVTVPACAGNIVVGQGYVITMTGLYGNVVQFQVTANG